MYHGHRPGFALGVCTPLQLPVGLRWKQAKKLHWPRRVEVGPWLRRIAERSEDATVYLPSLQERVLDGETGRSMKKANASKDTRYKVLRDTSEKKGKGWLFETDEACSGTELRNLYTGDYSLEGYYDTKVFVIERKGGVAEFVANITQKEKWEDFRNELERLEEFRFPFIICEFPYSLVEQYPLESGIPKKFQYKIRVTPQFLVKRLWEIQLHFKTKILFADRGGKDAASSLFKRIKEKVPDPSCP